MKRISTFLALVLRHAPERIGLTLDAGGWADVDALIAAARGAGVALDRETLAAVVATNDKKRFTFSPDGMRIRAAQGHSVAVELGLAPAEPPAILFHGTARAALATIRAEGLKPNGRQHVHLSRDRDTALAVGRRHGEPVVLRVSAGRMWTEGHLFRCADNGVWLTDEVPPAFLDD